MNRFFSVVVASLVVIATVPMSAQTCLGFPSFSAGAVRTGGGVVFGDHSKTYGVELAAGAKTGPFASGQVGQLNEDDVSGHATIASGTVGYSLPLGKARVCPVAEYDHAWLPDVDDGTNIYHSRLSSYQLGGSIGTSVSLTAAVSVAPFFSAAYVHTSGSISAASGGVTISASTYKNYGDLGGGLGLVLNRSVTLRVGADVPVGLEDVKPTVTVGAAFNFLPR